MKYEEFKEKLVKGIEEKVAAKYLEGSYKVNCKRVPKNGKMKDGLSILRPLENVSFAATLYVEDLYQEFCNGLPMHLQDMIDHVTDTLCNAKIPDEVKEVVNFWNDEEEVKSRIYFEFVNYERNKEMLETIPHRLYMDIAVLYRIYIYSNENGDICSTKVQNDMLDHYHLTEEELYQLALQNTPRLFPAMIMDNFMPTFKILTHEMTTEGSVVILYPKLLKNLAEQFNSDLYLLPASVDEFLAMSTKHAELEDLQPIVQAVNETCVSENEYLSDSVYYYDRIADKVYRC